MNSIHSFAAAAASASALALLLVNGAASATAQCTNPWLSGGPLSGANSTVFATTRWDPDGTGPLPERLVVGGGFTTIGGIASTAIASFDPVAGTWHGFDGGMSVTFFTSVTVRALAVLPNGDLVAAGQFLRAGSVDATNIARWDGSSWQPYANGIGGIVYALATLPNGDLVAGGSFFVADGVAVDNVARWTGSTWAPLGSGINGKVEALARAANGDLVAGGVFTAAGGSPATYVARWNGSTWSSLGGGLTGDVHAVLALPNGDVVVGGGFLDAGGVGANAIARWNGSSWAALGSGMGNPVWALALAPNGDVLAGGQFVAAGGVPADRVARWNGNGWAPLAAGFPSATSQVFTLGGMPNGEPVAGGTLTSGDGLGTNHLVRFDGVAWRSVSGGTTGTVTTSLRLRNGDLVVGGTFGMIGGVPARRVARWDGTSWSPLGTGVSRLTSLAGQVNCAIELPNGDLVVGGLFTEAGGTVVANIARWDGVAWSPLGAGLPGPVWSLALRPNGELVAGGAFPERVAIWNGSTWSGTGITSTLAASFPVRALAVLPNGDLAASSLSIAASSNHARWDGTTWTALPGLGSFAQAYRVARNGDLLAAGGFVGGPLARWNGTSWTVLGGGAAAISLALEELPNGDVLVGGQFTTIANQPFARIARWDGSVFHAVGAGCDAPVRTLTRLANGDVFVGGDFLRADGAVSAVTARLSTTCPASSLAFGSACVGSGGLNVLAARDEAWLGGTATAAASGMPGNGVVLGVVGFTAAILPLATVLPQAGGGCSLLALPDLLELQVPSSGVATLTVAIPPSAALVGQAFYQQALGFEFGPASVLLAVTSSNALQRTIGSF